MGDAFDWIMVFLSIVGCYQLRNSDAWIWPAMLGAYVAGGACERLFHRRKWQRGEP